MKTILKFFFCQTLIVGIVSALFLNDARASLANKIYSYKEALKSFEKTWTPPIEISAEKLARAGFYRDNDPSMIQTDAVQCPICQLSLFKWEKIDDPLHDHLRDNPLCPLANAIRNHTYIPESGKSFPLLETEVPKHHQRTPPVYHPASSLGDRIRVVVTWKDPEDPEEYIYYKFGSIAKPEAGTSPSSFQVVFDKPTGRVFRDQTQWPQESVTPVDAFLSGLGLKNEEHFNKIVEKLQPLMGSRGIKQLIIEAAIRLDKIPEKTTNKLLSSLSIDTTTLYLNILFHSGFESDERHKCSIALSHKEKLDRWGLTSDEVMWRSSSLKVSFDDTIVDQLIKKKVCDHLGSSDLNQAEKTYHKLKLFFDELEPKHLLSAAEERNKWVFPLYNGIKPPLVHPVELFFVLALNLNTRGSARQTDNCTKLKQQALDLNSSIALWLKAFHKYQSEAIHSHDTLQVQIETLTAISASNISANNSASHQDDKQSQSLLSQAPTRPEPPRLRTRRPTPQHLTTAHQAVYLNRSPRSAPKSAISQTRQVSGRSAVVQSGVKISQEETFRRKERKESKESKEKAPPAWTAPSPKQSSTVSTDPNNPQRVFDFFPPWIKHRYTMKRRLDIKGSESILYLIEGNNDGQKLVLKKLKLRREENGPRLSDLLRTIQKAQTKRKDDDGVNFITKIHCVYYNPVTDGEHLYLFESYHSENLLQWLIRHPDNQWGKTVNQMTSLKQSIQITKALQWFHLHGMMHRDIKANNIMLTENGDIAITDFGFLIDTVSLTQSHTPEDSPSHHYDKICTTVCGTRETVAPEVIPNRRGQRYSDGYGVSSEIWSLAAVIWQVYGGMNLIAKPDYMSLDTWNDNRDYYKKYHQALNKVFPESSTVIDRYEKLKKTVPTMPEYILRLCAASFDRNPDKRPSLTLILEQLNNPDHDIIILDDSTGAVSCENETPPPPVTDQHCLAGFEASPEGASPPGHNGSQSVSYFSTTDDGQPSSMDSIEILSFPTSYKKPSTHENGYQQPGSFHFPSTDSALNQSWQITNYDSDSVQNNAGESDFSILTTPEENS
ncbi:protein kinase domain-containing protein [Candidatus Sororendozoicomonas aggregata]|uniref:protein kinase domain-containing protein n=1 Tax=Candidatus Sororendozoicomonas aggregata TaxID=3073239 RepID=UPI002ED4F2CF